MSSVHWQARQNEDGERDGGSTRRRSSLLGVLALGRGRRVSRQDKGKQRASLDIEERDERIDEHERLRQAAARSIGLHSILPELGEGDADATVRRRPPALDLHGALSDPKQAARDEAAAKLCGLVPSVPPLPPVPLFPCAQSALAAHTQLSGPLLKHHPPTTLARLVGAKSWKPRHAVLCTYSLYNCNCAQPHRSSQASGCDAATRTLACLHIFATPTPDALELARLIVSEDSVVFVVEPTLAPDDSRRGPRDLDGRKWVMQVQGVNGAPSPSTADRQPKRTLSRRRESVGAATASLKSGFSARPRTVASLSVTTDTNSSYGLNPSSNFGIEDDAQVHAVWFLQCPDADARQRWISCIKRAVLLQRAERAGFGGTVHFTSPRSVTDPLPSGDLDVVLALRAQAQSAHIAQLRASTSPHIAPPSVISQPVTPVATTFNVGLTSSFTPVFTPGTATFSPTSPGFSQSSDHSHGDVLSLAFTRSQTPTYAPSTHTTHTTHTQQGQGRSRSNTVTSPTPVQALRGFFSLNSGGSGSRPPSRSASIAGGSTKGGNGGKKSRARATSSATTSGGLPYPHPYAHAHAHPPPIPIPSRAVSLASGHGHGEGQSPAPTSVSFASALDTGVGIGVSDLYSQPHLHHPYPHPYMQSHGPVMLGTPISAGLGSMDLSDRTDRERERDDGPLGLNAGYGGAGLPGLGVNGLPGLGPNGISGLSALNGKTITGSSGGKGVATSLPPPPRSRRAGSVSHTLPGQGRTQDEGLQMGRVQEESLVPNIGRSGRSHMAEESSRRGEMDAEDNSRRPSLVPMMSLSFGQQSEDLRVHAIMGSAAEREDTDGDDDDDDPNPDFEPPHRRDMFHSRILPPKLAPPSAPLPVPPGSWPSASESSASMYSVQTTSTGAGARVRDDTVRSNASDAHTNGSGVLNSLDARGNPDMRNGLDVRSNSMDVRSRVSLGDGSRPNMDVPWSRSHVSLRDVPQENPMESRVQSRVSLALVRGVLAQHPEGEIWDEGDMGGTMGSFQEDVRESPTWTSVHESPTRPSGRGNSPAAYTRRSTSDSPIGTVPSSPSSQVSGPGYSSREGTNGHSLFPRESYGSAFFPREIFEGDDRPIQFSHPFANAPVQVQSQGRRAHRRTGSYGGPALFTITDSPLVRSKSQRSKSENLPPAAPPPCAPLPPLPPMPISRPATPISRPRTPSRPGTESLHSTTPASPQFPIVSSQPRHTSLRTRLRMLSAPSPAPQSALPEPPRDLGALIEDGLAQPISKVPISLLVRDDSSARRIELSANRRDGDRETAPSLPPPPRIRMVRQHSHSASSGGEITSEGRRSDESGPGNKGGARDSAVHLENRGE